MVVRPYSHEGYLASKESRKRATLKWLSDPDVHKKHNKQIHNWMKRQYKENTEWKEKYRQYQKEYRKQHPELKEKWKQNARRERERKYLRSVNGDLVKFAEYLDGVRTRQPRSLKGMRRPYVPHSQSFNQARRNALEKANLFAFYGGRCAMCGEDDMTVLQMHHINGDGGKHRSELNWREVRKEMYYHPNWNRYQLLCFNCHIEVHRFFYGGFTSTHPSE